MTVQEKAPEKERRDWIIILIILLFGLLCVIVAGGWAIRFAPAWRLNSDMGSNIDPNSNFQTNQPSGFIEPLDPAILTQPVWQNVFLTPGATLQLETLIPPTQPTSTPPATNTITPTVVIPPTFTATMPSPTNTVIYYPPPLPTNTKKPPPPPPPTSTNTPAVNADLQITKTDNDTAYVGSAVKTYVITVSNAGPTNVTGATVLDLTLTNAANPNIASATWTCSATGSATCTAMGSGNINDTVDVPVGETVTYTVTANVVASPSGPLINAATVVAPSGITDPVPTNNLTADTDELVTASGPVDSTLGGVTNYPAGSFITLQFGTSVTVTPTDLDGYDLVYYPDPVPPTLQMGAVILQIGDGSNWYTILNWGDGSPDGNTDIPSFPPNTADCTSEPDNCLIDTVLLTNSPGISIQLDGIVPAGTYPYIRIFSPSNPPDTNNDGVSVDAIQILP